MYSVMIVDDTEVFRKQIKQFSVWKKHNNFKIVSEAGNGMEAFEKLTANPVDLAIVDIKMPKMDGIELLKEIKENNLCPCVVLLSEFSDFTFARQALVLGAFDYIVKPIEEGILSDLLDRVEQFLEKQMGKDYHTIEVKRLVSLIINGDIQAMEAAPDIVSSVEQITDGNLIRCGAVLAELAENIYEEVFKAKPWLSNFIRFSGDSILRYVSEDMLKNSFESCMKELVMKIRELCPMVKSDLINSVFNYVLTHVDEKITLNLMANQLFVNKTYLSHTFKVEVGMTFMEYLTSIKVERAKYMLEEDGIKIYEVARKLGYDDAEYFSRIFKSKTGRNPTQYRK